MTSVVRPVIVLAERLDATADLVVRALAARGAEVFRCDTAEFPTALTLRASLRGGWRGELRNGHRAMSLDQVGGVYVRRPTRFGLPEAMPTQAREFAIAEARRGFGGVLMSLACRWVNHPGRNADAEYKPLQLDAAVRCGHQVPRTVITNCPAVARAFAAGIGRPIVYKTLSQPAVAEPDGISLIYTTEIAADHLEDRRIAFTAHMFQERVPKAYDVRATVVGERVFAVAVRAGDQDAPPLDWRACYCLSEPAGGSDPAAMTCSGQHRRGT